MPSLPLPGRQPLFLPHKLQGPLERGVLLERPNRFLGRVERADGSVVEAHIADRGRLADILFPGAEVYLARAPEGSARRTAFTLLCVRCPALDDPATQGPLTCLDPAGANRQVRALLEAGLVPGIPPFTTLRQEVKAGHSRFDFALELEDGRRMWVEVKSAAAAAGSAVMFPDAPSERASRHCHELAELSLAGDAAAIILVAQRADVSSIRPHPVDPAFAMALSAAKQAGVLLLGVAFEVDLDGFRHRGSLPVELPT